MKYFTVLFFIIIPSLFFAQNSNTLIDGIIKDEQTSKPISFVNIININTVKGAVTNDKGHFEIYASANDTLHITYLGYKTLKVRVTNDWIKNKSTEINLTSSAVALEEVVIKPFKLTGYLEVDIKLVPQRENYRYSISGLSQGYEAGQYSPNAFNRVMSSVMNPADMLYNTFGKKGNELKRLREMKKDDTVKNLLESKFDRETIASLLGVSKEEITEILSRCSYSESFITTANDLQIMDAISACYEEYKILKRTK